MSIFSPVRRPTPWLTGAAIVALAALGAAGGMSATYLWHDRGAAAQDALRLARLQPARFEQPLSGSLADMVQAVIPSVVQVQVTGVRPHPAGVVGPDSAPGDALRHFFDDGPPAADGNTDEVLGSGFAVAAPATGEALIVTNAHVVEGGSRIRIRLSNGREIAATLVGVDSKTDLAVLRVKGADLGLIPVKWGDSDHARVGDSIFAVGSPFGLGSTVTSGIISGRGREIGEGPYDDFLQIDAAINQGNSGGPLFDRSGRVIGVNTAIYSPDDSGGNVGIGFAIPAHIVQRVVSQLVSNGHVVRGQIGVAIQPVTADIADSLGLAEPKGALIAGVSDGSPAASAGLHIGDIVTRFDGSAIDSARDLSRVVAETPVGQAKPVEILRDGKRLTLQIAVMRSEKAAPVAVPTAATISAPAAASVLGLTVVQTNATLNGEADQPVGARGVIVTRVDPASVSAERGLTRGDLIVAANNARVDTPQALKTGVDAASRAGRHNVLLEILRGQDHAFVAVPLG